MTQSGRPRAFIRRCGDRALAPWVIASDVRVRPSGRTRLPARMSVFDPAADLCHGTGASVIRIVRRLKSTTTQPTRSIRTLSVMSLVAIAANGAAITPPMIRPAMIGHRLKPTVRKKVV